MILNGFQMELVLEEIESIQVVNHAIEINEGNYNILENNLRLSWNENIDLIKEGELLFELLLSNQSFNNFDLNAHFANELYIGDLLEIANLKLVPVVQPIGSANEVKFESINIAPNPFESTARFSFESIIEENVELKIFDLNGHLISNKVVPINIGLNSIELYKSDFGKSGVYMISFQSGTTRLSRKITIL